MKHLRHLYEKLWNPSSENVSDAQLIEWAGNQIDRMFYRIKYFTVDAPIEKLRFRPRIRAALTLKLGKDATMVDVCSLTRKELLAIKGFGKKSLAELEADLMDYSLKLSA